MARKRRSHRQGTLFKRHGRGVWVAQWHDHAGKRMFRSTGTTDRAAAERILTKYVADAALRREGGLTREPMGSPSRSAARSPSTLRIGRRT